MLPGSRARRAVWHTCLHRTWQSEVSGFLQSGSPPGTSPQTLDSSCSQLFQCVPAKGQETRREKCCKN